MKKFLFYTLFFALFFLIIFIIKRQSRDIYFSPSYIPEGYKSVEVENNVVSGSMGLGYVIKFKNDKNDLVEVTTYKDYEKMSEFMNYCKEIKVEYYKNIKVITINGQEVCSYEFENNIKSKQYYLNVQDKTVRIIDGSQNYLSEAEVVKIINSLSKKYW